MGTGRGTALSATEEKQRPNPAWSDGRIVGLDMARWLALVGMIATHALRPVEASGHATLVESVAAGRSSALFAVLAGVSLALMSGGPRPLSGPELRSVAAGLAVRAVLIGIVGLLLAGLGTLIAIILTYYAVLFVAGLPFLRLRARTLAVLAGVWIVAGPLLSHLIRPALAAQGLPEVNVASPRFVDLERPLNLLVVVVFTGWYPVFTWLAYLLLGLALGRSRLDRVRTALAVLGSGAALAVAASTVSDWLLARPGAFTALGVTMVSPPARDDLVATLELGLTGTTPTGSTWWLAIDAPHSGTPLDLALTGGSALAVIGACLLVTRLAPRVFAVVFGAGAMPLTLYCVHIVLRTPGLLDDDSPAVFWLHVLTVTLIGSWFRSLGLKGPLEAVVARASGVVRRTVAGRESATRPS
ncbi:MAG: heparan-alpha-glucosaminide N-acetyltransferase domain-containing protein [Nocardioidaceae bacterium]